MTRLPWARAAVALLAVVGVAGCSVAAENTARATPADRVPFSLLDAEAPALVPDPGGRPHAVCLAGDGRLRPIERMLEPGASLAQILRSLTQEVSDDEAARGLRSALDSDVEIRSATVHRGTAIVDFTTAPELFGQDRILAVGQIVCTLAHQPGIGQVSFTVAGAPLQVPIDDASLTSDPVTTEDYSTLGI